MKKGGELKKSQVSAFVIIAILIIAVMGIYFAFKANVLNLERERINPSILPVYSFVENCIKTTGENAVYYIGQTGGYFISPNLSTDNKIAYYLYNKENYMPSKEKIEEELSEYMNSMLFFCTKNFEDFKDFGIKQGEIKTNAKIKGGYAAFDVDYPLSISKDSKSYFFEKFENIEIPARLDIVYNLAYEIMQEQMFNKKSVCIGCINQLAFERDLYVEMKDYKENNKIFIIKDKKSKILNDDFRFYFANKYENL